VAAGSPVPAIYFLSDYGLVDEFVGVVHAVLHRRAPGVPVIDLAHQVPAFQVAAGGAALARAAPHLGSGVVLAVVDPGVATARRGLAVGLVPGSASGPRPAWLVGPDNGLLVPALAVLGGAESAYRLTGGNGSTFDGRDLFAPAAAHLVTGGDPAQLGPRIDPGTLVPAPPAPPDREVGTTLITSVAWVDAFGNVQLRATPELLDGMGMAGGPIEVVVVEPHQDAPVLTARRVTAFAELGPGELGVLVDASGQLALVVDRGSAADLLGLGTHGPGPTVRLAPAP
jgi:S-adenosyl-L-methionine hydrolase (adenosine-forming)